MVFGRLMTNGVWAESPQDLEKTLTALHEAGFDGTFGVSVDSYHAQVTEELTRFFQTVFAVWGRRDRCEIISVTTSDGETPKGRFESLAESLGGRLLWRTESRFPSSTRPSWIGRRPPTANRRR